MHCTLVNFAYLLTLFTGHLFIYFVLDLTSCCTGWHPKKVDKVVILSIACDTLYCQKYSDACLYRHMNFNGIPVLGP